MTYLVSILIPTILERQDKYDTMVSGLYEQIKKHNLQDKVEIISISDNRNIPVVTKRNMLQKLSSGKYFTHLDDDDEFSDDYCKTVVDHIEYLPTFQANEPDCIGYDQLAKVQGKRFIVKPNIKCGLHLTPTNGTTNYPEFYRFPWQYNLWHEKYKKVYRTKSDGSGAEDPNWLKKIQLEYPKNMSYIPKILHTYNFDDPSLSTTQEGGKLSSNNM